MSYSILNCLKLNRRMGLHNSTTANDKFQEEDATLTKCYLMSRIVCIIWGILKEKISDK